MLVVTRAIILSVICTCSIVTSSTKAAQPVSENEGTPKKFPVFFRNSVALGYPLKKIVLGDFNGDRVQDVAGIAANSKQLIVLYGRKSGGFDPEKRYALQFDSEELQVAGLNRDQKDDLVLLYGKQSVLKAFLSADGKKMAGGPEINLVDAPQTMRVVRDEKGVNVFTINKNYKVQAYKYQAGKFERLQEPFPKKAFNDIAGSMAPVNDIGYSYFACTDPLYKTVEYVQKQIPEFLEPARYPLDADPICLHAYDLNKNSVVDAIVGLAPNPLSGKSASLKVIYDLGVESDLPPVELQAGIRPQKIIARDINGDSLVDLVVLDAAEKTVSIYYGKRDGGFYDRVLLSTGGEPNDILVYDLDKDGEAEILLCSKAQNELIVYTTTSPRRGSYRIPVAPEPVALTVSGTQSDPRLVVACGSAKRQMYFEMDGQQWAWKSRRLETRPDRIWSVGKDGLISFSSESDKLTLYTVKPPFDLVKKSELQVPALDIAGGFLWNPQNGATTVISLYDRGNKQIQPRLLHYKIELSAKAPLSEVKAASRIQFGKVVSFNKVADKRRTSVVFQSVVSDKETEFRAYAFGKLTEAGGATEEKNVRIPRQSKDTKLLVAGNFDGDSRPDLVVADPAGGSVLSSGNRYEPLAIKGLNLVEDDYVTCLDINGDQNMDLLIGKKDTATLWAVKGLGNGEFTNPRKLIGDVFVKDAAITGGDRPMIAVANNKLDTVDLIPVSSVKW